MRMPNVVMSLASIAIFGLSAAGTANGQTGCDVLGGTVRTGTVCEANSSTANYRMDIRFPLNYPDEGAIVAYLTQNRDGFVNVAQTPDSRNLPYEMDVTSETFSSGTPPAGTQSVVLKLFQDVGGAHPVTWYKAFTYSLNQHRPVTFDTVFPPGSIPLASIYPIVARELERETGLTGGVSPSEGLDPSNYQDFAITDDSVIFFFGQGVLLPSDAGATSASVPRSAIPPLQV